MAYQQLLEDCMDNPPGHIVGPIVVRDIDPDQWLGRYQNQIEDLDMILGDGVHVIYEDGNVYVKYKNLVTFRIQHLEKVEPSGNDNPDLLELDTKYENNIYIESITGHSGDSDVTQIPVYTEGANTVDSKVLGNFWMSFVEHGLSQVLESFNITDINSV